jgi:hypothetical protein
MPGSVRTLIAGAGAIVILDEWDGPRVGSNALTMTVIVMSATTMATKIVSISEALVGRE